MYNFDNSDRTPDFNFEYYIKNLCSKTIKRRNYGALNFDYEQGIIAFNNKDYSLAENYFKKGIRKEKGSTHGHFFLGKTYFFSDINQCLHSLTQYFEPYLDVTYLQQMDDSFPPDLEEAFFLSASGCHIIEQFHLASYYYNYALEINSTNAITNFNLGLCAMELAQAFQIEDSEISYEHLREAKNCFKRALEFSKNSQYYWGMGRWHEASLDYFQKLTIKQRNDYNFHYDLAIFNYFEALNQCKTESPLKNIILSHLFRCIAKQAKHLYENKEFNRAEQLYTFLDENSFTHPKITRNGVSLCLLQQHYYKNSRLFFTNALEKTDSASERSLIWLNIALTYRFEKRFSKAELAIYEAKKMTNDHDLISLEEKKLTHAKASYSLISAPQILFKKENAVINNNSAIIEFNFC